MTSRPPLRIPARAPAEQALLAGCAPGRLRRSIKPASIPEFVIVAQRVSMCYGGLVPRVISQRELRNDSAAIMDAVERGETIVVTRNGNAVAELRPLQRRSFAPTAELLRAFRGLPRMSLPKLRREADELLGDEDRIDG